MISGTTKAAKPQRLYLNTNTNADHISYADVLAVHVRAARARITNTQAHEAINTLIAGLFGVSADEATYFHPEQAQGRYDNINVTKWQINLDTLSRDLALWKALDIEAKSDVEKAKATYARYSLLGELAAEGFSPCLEDTLATLGFDSIEEACSDAALEVNDLEHDLKLVDSQLQQIQEWCAILGTFDTSLRSTAIALGYDDALDARDQPRIATVYSLPLADGREVVAPLEAQAVLQDVYALVFGVGNPESVVKKYTYTLVDTVSPDDFIDYGRSVYASPWKMEFRSLKP